MRTTQALLSTIESIHGAGLDPDRWPDAMEDVRRFVGAAGASVEIYDYGRRRHRLWRGAGVEPEMLEQYLAFHSPENPYAPGARTVPAERRFYGDLVLDPSGLDREPFYASYITFTDPRCLSAVFLDDGRGDEVVLTASRYAGCGHARAEDAAALAHLAPHVKTALQVAARLNGARHEAHALSQTLDLIPSGAVLLDAQGGVIHANAAFQAMARENDGVSLTSAGVGVACPMARRRLGEALTAAMALARGEGTQACPAFTVPRPSGGPPYTMFARPLLNSEQPPDGAAAVLFVHSPLAADPGGGLSAALRDMLGLTAAETHLASALVRGVSPSDYARARKVSINTVYTHLRRLKDKTGAHRMAELIHLLNAGAA